MPIDHDNSGALFQDTQNVDYEYSGNLSIEGNKLKVFGKKKEFTKDGKARTFIAVEGDGADGALFPNANKKSESHPDMGGHVKYRDKDYWFNAWVRVAKHSGKKFYSLSVRPKEEKRETKAAAVESYDDVPF